MWVAEAARRAEIRAAIELEESEPGPPLPPLPDLAQVTGWSRASGRAPHNPGVALFGGWRIADMEESLRAREAGDRSGLRLGPARAGTGPRRPG